MLTKIDKWKVIERLAETHGVSKETRRKWRSRGVPPAWQIKFVRAAPTALNFDDFGSLRLKAAS
jgi:hypothetical protein